MPEVIVGRVDDPPTWTAAAQAFRAWNPGYTLGQGTVGSAAEALLTPTPGAVRYCWLFDGRGEVWLPAGYRTQEGDGTRLPAAYRPDPLDPEAQDALATLRAALTTADGVIPEEVRAPLTAIMEALAAARSVRRKRGRRGLAVAGERYRAGALAGRRAGHCAALAGRTDGDARLVHQAARLLGAGRRRRSGDRARRGAAPHPRGRSATGGSRTTPRQPGPRWRSAGCAISRTQPAAARLDSTPFVGCR